MSIFSEILDLYRLILSRFRIWRTPCKLLAYPQGYAYPRLRTAGLHYLQTFYWNVQLVINHNSIAFVYEFTVVNFTVISYSITDLRVSNSINTTLLVFSFINSQKNVTSLFFSFIQVNPVLVCRSQIVRQKYKNTFLAQTTNNGFCSILVHYSLSSGRQITGVTWSRVLAQNIWKDQLFREPSFSRKLFSTIIIAKIWKYQRNKIFL